ncbi:MAG: heparinase II/III family protein [Clostridia bacterium]
MKNESTFFGLSAREEIRRALKSNAEAAKTAAAFLESASWWMETPYDELSKLPFTPELKRSWFVLSDGNCPLCGDGVPMYNWLHDAMARPWKMKCPHCGELFPRNDFKAYYDSGLDEKGVFSRNLADASLLVNETGGSFGVDDGNGWVDGKGRRYLFIAAYLVYARWIRQIVDGIYRLAFSHVLTENPEYARRAFLMLDSVARFFPDYDYRSQGVMYEKENCSDGYVSYWANSSSETRILAIAYDQIYECIRSDNEIAAITGKPVDESFAAIENRILLEVLANGYKIEANPPVSAITNAIIRSVLDFKDDRDGIISEIDGIIKDATLIDGLSGEKGLSGYTMISPRAIADLICLYTNTDSNFMGKILNRHPVLLKTYRFHIDTWYDNSYYPGIGDAAAFAVPTYMYTALFISIATENNIIHRSRDWFARELSRITGDPDFAKAMYISYGRDASACFANDLYIENPDELRDELENFIRENGMELRQASIDYSQWRIAVLHTGSGSNKAMAAIPYDSGANHCHHDALSLHLFAKGSNMTPDFGYPPVNYGGWETKEVDWYRHPSSHNSVVVDGRGHTNLPDGRFLRYPEFGRCLMLSSGSFVNASYCDAREYAGTDRYERLVALVDISESDCYCLDISRTDGGREHTKFLRSSFSSLSHEGLEPLPGGVYYPETTIMRNFSTDPDPGSGWYVDFSIHEAPGEPPEKELHLRYTGLTPGVSISLCESWVDITRMTRSDDSPAGNRAVWIPTLMEQAAGPRTCFTGILESYEGKSNIVSVTPVEITAPGDFARAVSVGLGNGFTDVLISNDPAAPGEACVLEYGIKTDALLAVLRFRNSTLEKATVCSGSYLEIAGILYSKGTDTGLIEFL